ncbi:polypeptide N-acetylgalactosaminyltransferase 10-like [Mizuhopecten yessoensis]|uniref:Polypeptide N-acetylgalactosaminyltransferase n=1 Tax=Mizuhopecten yessoensis TaxID=6573 RepID=A0A210QDQ6_MIZYE|nr:polypeptide N-acetylgalactosaminyltransferase 10-like [Mizuhopecten yessoensis]OWF46856.1 Polypeptide N-acetylgalactosaminyltransferase 10 [Mizuhopecten yessoensis]
MFPRNLRFFLKLIVVLAWSSMVAWVINTHRPTFTGDGRLLVNSPLMEPGYGGDSNSAVKRNWKSSNVANLANRKRKNEFGPKGNNAGNYRQSFSDIIQEFGISLFKDTDPSRFFINVNKSHATPVSREVPATRSAECASVLYDNATLPVASIVIPLHNEPWSTFERLINSILKNSPPPLIHEIIIIDDLSNLEHLGAPLDKYVAQFDFMQIHRAHERLGSMKTRFVGTSIATGEVVVFLDSHTEVNIGWLEPLLYEIDKDRRTIIQPSIDLVDPETFQYRRYFANDMRGHFQWSMAYSFVPLTPKQKAEVAAKPTKAFNTPAIVGCAFAVNRKYFLDIGGLDTGMRIWGGEDVELSIRVWLCGGSMKISPCSHVAHIFKSGHPFKMDYSDLIHNNRRTAEMWLGDYKRYFYYFSSALAQSAEPSEKFDEMDKIKQKFKCKGFDWLLQNVYPELEVPPEGSEHFGHLRNLGSGYCFGPSENRVLGDNPIIVIGDCFAYYKVRNFALLGNGQLKMDGKCIEVDRDYLIVTPCITGSGRWDMKQKLLVYADDDGSSKCVGQVVKTINLVETAVAMTLSCTDYELKYVEWEIGTKLSKMEESWAKA